MAKQEKIAELQAKLDEFEGIPADPDALFDLHEGKYVQLQQARKKFENGIATIES